MKALLLAAPLMLGGCIHFGPRAQAGVGVSTALFTAVNQDWIAGKLDFLRIGPAKTAVTPPSATTSPAAQ